MSTERPHLYVFIPHAHPTRAMVIHRSGTSKKQLWQMIAWDRATDTFTRGQWLAGKELDPRLSSISPCGSYFYYHYDVYSTYRKEMGVVKENYYTSVDAVSAIPNFTALLYSDCGAGKWDAMKWDGPTGLPFIHGNGHGLKGDFPYVAHFDGYDRSRLLPYGPAPVLPDGITIDGYRLLRDGAVILDCTDDVFEARAPTPAPPNPPPPAAHLVTPPPKLPSAPPPPRVAGTCTGNKKDGSPCTRYVATEGTRCFQHKE